MVINITGLQRMLIQKNFKEILLAFHGDEVDYQSTRRILMENLGALADGGPALINLQTGEKINIPPAPDRTIKAKLNEQAGLLNEWIKQSDEFIKLPKDDKNCLAKQKELEILADKFLALADDSTRLFARYTENKTSVLLTFYLVLTVFIMLAGIFIFWLVSRLSIYSEDLKQKVNELNQSRLHLQKLSNTVEQSADLVIITDKQGVIEYVNPACEKITGYNKEEMVGQTTRILKSGQHDELFYKNIWETVLAGKVYRGIVINKKKDGELYYEEKIITPLKNSQRQITNFVSTGRDITWRVKIEESMEDTNRRLREAINELKTAQKQIIQQERLRALGQMISGVSHDFNNFLMPILGFSEMILLNPDICDDKEKSKHYLNLIHTSAKDAANLIKRLRDLYRPREEVDAFEEVNLSQLVEEAVLLTQPKWKQQAQVNGMTINIKTELQQIPLISFSPSELKQVLINLIFNAVDAMPKGGVITIKTLTEENYIKLEVGDTGLGMTEEVKQRCFEPFFSTKDSTEGSGLGLALVYSIVTRYQGKIEVQSEPGSGTTFIIHLPLKAAPEKEVPAKKIEIVLTPLKILVVEDDPIVREILNLYLTADGHLVDMAVDGLEGLEKFKGGKYDLVITDGSMPKMSGDKLATLIKQISPRMPIILISGFSDVLNDIKKNLSDVDLVISKPVSLSKLHRAVAEVIKKYGK